MRVLGRGSGQGFELRDSGGGDAEHLGDLCPSEIAGPQLRNGLPAKPCQVGEQGLLLGHEPAQLLGTPPRVADREKIFLMPLVLISSYPVSLTIAPPLAGKSKGRYIVAPQHGGHDEFEEGRRCHRDREGSRKDERPAGLERTLRT